MPKGIAQIHTTTVLDCEQRVGLTVLTVPGRAIPAQPLDIDEGREVLGLRLRHRFLCPTDVVLHAALEAVLIGSPPTAVIERIHQVLRERPEDSSLAISSALYDVVARCADEQIVLVDEQGHVLHRALSELTEESDGLWVAYSEKGQRTIVVAISRPETWLFVAPAGLVATDLGVRLMQGVVARGA